MLALNTTPPVTVTTARTPNTRRMEIRCPPTPRGAEPCIATGASVRTCQAKPSPSRIATTPGRMNAARQPKCAVRKPVSKAAKATPRLPHMPFMPISWPRFSACATSIAVPTGW
ncbi:hypothetical protein D3C80_1283040 [compost metagenome]